MNTEHWHAGRWGGGGFRPQQKQTLETQTNGTKLNWMQTTFRKWGQGWSILLSSQKYKQTTSHIEPRLVHHHWCHHSSLFSPIQLAAWSEDTKSCSDLSALIGSAFEIIIAFHYLRWVASSIIITLQNAANKAKTFELDAWMCGIASIGTPASVHLMEQFL